MFDSNDREIGRFNRLKVAAVIQGTRYTHRLTFKSEKGVSYVLNAETAKGKKLKGDFNPPYIIRQLEGKSSEQVIKTR